MNFITCLAEIPAFFMLVYVSLTFFRLCILFLLVVMFSIVPIKSLVLLPVPNLRQVHMIEPHELSWDLFFVGGTISVSIFLGLFFC